MSGKSLHGDATAKGDKERIDSSFSKYWLLFTALNSKYGTLNLRQNEM